MVAAAQFLYVMLIFFFLSAILFALTYTGQQTLPLLANLPGYNTAFPGSTVTPYTASNSIIAIYPQFNQYLPFIFIMVNLAIIASILVLPLNSLTIPLTFAIMIITVIVSFIFSNSISAFFTNQIFSTVVPYFGQVIQINANLGLYEIIFIFIYMIILAARIKLSGGGTSSVGATIG